jgi:hypothetical protein
MLVPVEGAECVGILLEIGMELVHVQRQLRHLTAHGGGWNSQQRRWYHF